MATSQAEISPRPLARPLYLSDGMLLVAGTAIGIALAGLWGRELAVELPTFKIAGWSTASRTRFAGYALATLFPASLTVLALRIRSPRPRMRLITRQPGAIACLSSTLALFGQALALPLDLRTMGDLTSPLLVAAFYWPTAVAAVVTTSWIVLALSRRWRARGDWVDRLGMVVGVCWIGLPPALFVIEYLLA